MSNVVEIKGLTKAYGKVKAVHDVSFSIEGNKIYGLLGRNGAGKTTIMHMITAQLFPTEGQLKVFGEEPYENNRVLSQICFIKESQRYPDNFRVKDVLTLAPSIFPNWDEDFAYELIELFDLPLDRRVKKLSRGMLSATGIVIGLASRAPLTIFDEPYLGLDAVARNLFYDRLIEDYAEHPRTIILSTHLIDEVSRILEHIVLIDKGKILIDEDADSLRGQAYTVVGSNKSIESYISGKKVIASEPFGGMSQVTILGKMDANDQLKASELSLEVAQVSLQQLIVHLTNGKAARKAVEQL